MADVVVSKEAQLRLVKLLVKLQLLQDDQVSQKYESTEFCPIAFFSRQQAFAEDAAIKAVANRIQTPLYTLNRPDQTEWLLLFDHNRLTSISLERWRDMRAVPVEIKANRLCIAMANPLDLQSQDSLKFDLGMDVQAGIAREDEILALIAKKMNASKIYDLESILDKSGSLETTSEKEIEEASRFESTVGATDCEAAPVVLLVNKIFSDAIIARASDIHINPEKEGLIVRIRVDGMMRHLFTVPTRIQLEVVSRLKLLSGMDISERRKPQDGRLRLKTGFGIKDLRLSTVPTVYGENLVIRILSSDISRLSFENLGASEKIIGHFDEALKGSSRVILVTGPTGSGKSSTLYASLLHLRDGTKNIMSIEDPIEYRITGVHQIQVNSKVTFADGLRSILRQDPDVIMVGEIRDYETGSIVMQAAQTGHLVLSTIHTNTAAAAVTRLRDLGLPSYLIASSIGSIVAQRLVRTLCSACAVPLENFDAHRLKSLGLDSSEVKGPKGCDQCGGSGYHGRLALFSLLPIDDRMREAIRNEKSESELEQLGRASGFQSLTEAALEFVRKGVTSIEEAERAIGTLGVVQGSAIQPKNSNATDASCLKKRRILLVEDDENTRSVLSMLLSRQMYEVVEAQDGQEALERIYENPPELIISDLMMPRMNGIELLKKIRLDSRIKTIPIIVLTAADTEEQEITLIDYGADDFVSKTADSKVMLARVQRLLARADT